ncbi:hypothetical protein [Archangium violaceum]
MQLKSFEERAWLKQQVKEHDAALDETEREQAALQSMIDKVER